MLLRLAPICILLLFTQLSQAADVPARPPTPAGQPKVRWHHPAGLVTAESIAEIKDKLSSQEWARRTYASQKAALAPWLAVPSAKLRQV
ncbi:MAG: hypothetical protein NT167_06955, partial [Verrucomicrobia bacterium]|nr:hypothetical protein [Verrucomicrobiota bacterium]